MITVHVGRELIAGEGFSGGWLANQLGRRGGRRRSLGVKVVVREQGVDLLLATPECLVEGTGGRATSSKEEEILALWRAGGLSRPDWKPAQLTAFIERVREVV